MERSHGPNEGPSAPEWRTPAEVSAYRETPDYGATRAFLERLARARPGLLRLESFGRSGEGRELTLAIVSQDGVFEPEAVRASGRVVLLVQNCIHAGETDGKDASLALLRDLVVGAKGPGLLERVVLLCVPVYNVDGHERRGAHQRINQNGPEIVGWRANGTNLNLNRDYQKAEAPETRAFLRLFHRWLPDFFIDNHVTDGCDFQYDVTFALDSGPDVHPPVGAWLRESVAPGIVAHVAAGGHLAFPGQVFLRDESDPAQGLLAYENPPRFSTGQMIVENRPGLLVEMHMLKDYRTRVTGNYLVLESVLQRLNRDAETLRRLNQEADLAAARLGGDPTPFPLVVTDTGETHPVEFRGRRYIRFPSEISGTTAIRYGPEPWDTTLPMGVSGAIAVTVRPPRGYIIPPAWSRVIEVLEAHGVTLRRTRAEWTGPVERYRLSGLERPRQPFEGRYPILRASPVEPAFGRFGRCVAVSETATYAAGAVVVGLDQRLARFVVHWLEPEAPDSALRWGFFDPIFERKESAEPYVLEALATEAAGRDPGLRREFEERIRSDPGFASSPTARLDFFFERSEWGRANRVGEYPVGRLRTLDGIPLA